MRKWIWGFTALVVFAAAGVYLAADYAAKHPDSLLAQMSAHLVSKTSPVAAITRTVHDRVLLRDGEDRIAKIKRTVEWTPIDRLVDLVEPIVVEAQPQPDDDAEEAEIPQEVLECRNRVPERLTTPPDRMPYADNESIDSEACECECQDTCPTGGCCECCSWFFDCCKSTANCWQRFVDFLFHTEADEDDKSAWNDFEELEMAAVEELTEEEASEPFETEMMEEMEMPLLEEDPHYHHHYPCCPYTGRCPSYQHRDFSVPCYPPAKMPADDEQAEDMDPEAEKTFTPDTSSSFYHPEDPYSPVHVNANTMECRPSEVLGGENFETPF